MNIKGTVLITGASCGIGCELAKVFARNKHNLVLVARNVDKLTQLADELTIKYGVIVNTIQQDLCETNAAQKLFDCIENMKINIDILVNNAGVGKVGLFHEMESSKDIEIIQLNIVSLTEMTKLFSREMVKRKYGKILNVASTGSFSPGPFTAVYYATKAYVLSLSEALSMELKEYNISVTALCPGATKTNFAKNAGKRDMPIAMQASKVARIAYNGLKNNKKIIIPGLRNKILVRLPKNLVSMVNFKSQRELASGKF